MIMEKTFLTKEASDGACIRWYAEQRRWFEENGYDIDDPGATSAYVDNLWEREGEKGIERESKRILSFYTFEEFIEGMEKLKRHKYPDDPPEDWGAFKRKWGVYFRPSF